MFYLCEKLSAFFFIILFLTTIPATAQVSTKLQAAYQSFTNDAQMKYGISGLVVVETATGKTVFSSNGSVGLAPASTLKVVTASTALDVLGSNFQFKTTVAYNGELNSGTLKGNVVIQASGDPTLASWRYGSTKIFAQVKQLHQAMDQLGIKSWEGHVAVEEGKFDGQATPGGWTYDDMGNYYGAGAAAFNWYENQYDLVLNPGSTVGSKVKIAGTRPVPNAIGLNNALSTGPQGSGDQAIIYADHYPGGTVRGTVPAGVKEFVISGSIADTKTYFLQTLSHYGNENNVEYLKNAATHHAYLVPANQQLKPITTWVSPGLDSIVYFFMQKSVNLYGEAMLKQLAGTTGGTISTETGVKFVRDYWKQRGIENGAMRIVDGSGLSPHNRITAGALVQVLQHARKQPWYPAFYEGLPTYNGIKMKSGTIRGVKGYTGYVTSKSGVSYTFAFLVNNYDGSASAITQKMFKVLDALK